MDIRDQLQLQLNRLTLSVGRMRRENPDPADFFPAFAGEMDTGLAPPPQSQAKATTTNGEMDTGITGQTETGSDEATDSATKAALNLLQSVLALL